MIPVWIYRLDGHRWCVLRAAHAGERITTLCADAFSHAAVQISTTRPRNACPACCTELAAGTPGAAAAMEQP